MNIGVIGSGNMGGGLGKRWAAKGHGVLFSDTHDATHLTALATDAGPTARTGTPDQAAQFGEVVLLTIRYADRKAALAPVAAHLSGKTVISCINPFKPDFSGLEIGLTSSGAEEVARLLPGANVVECLFLNATVINSPAVTFGETVPTVFFCGDSPDSKARVAALLSDLGVEGVDAGALASARYLEPYAMLGMTLGAQAGWKTDFAFKLLRR